MDLQLFSIEQMPTAVPMWDTILEDLGRPHPVRVARVLGVGRTTVYRWNAAGNAPRAALLALFWLTRWGRSAVHTQATNDALMAVQLARSYREECNRLRALGPDELAWPAIEPAAQQAAPPLDLPRRFCVVGTETSPQDPCQPMPPSPHAACASTPPARRPAASIPPIQGGSPAMKPALQGAVTTAPARPTAPANKAGASSKAVIREVARAGTPLSASRPGRPAFVGEYPHTPAPRAPGADSTGPPARGSPPPRPAPAPVAPAARNSNRKPSR